MENELLTFQYDLLRFPVESDVKILQNSDAKDSSEFPETFVEA